MRTWDGLPESEGVQAVPKSLGKRVVLHFERHNGHGYRGDSRTGDVSVVYASRLPTSSRAEVKARMLPLASLRQVAEMARRKRYPEGRATEVVLRSKPHFGGASYNFLFGQVLPENGAWTDTAAIVG